MQVQPGARIPIVRQLGLPDDTGTYYVNAVIRNSSTNALIETVTLTDVGDQRFTGLYIAPADPMGLGYFIDITSYVYTDSAYTTLSQLYQIEQFAYRVFDMFRNVGGGQGGGDYTDYGRIQKYLKEMAEDLAKRFPKIEKPEKVTFEKVLDAIREMGNDVKKGISGSEIAIKSHINKEFEVMTEVRNAILKAISALPVFKETDLSPVTQAIDQALSSVEAKIDLASTYNLESVQGAKDEIIGVVEEKIDGENKAIEDFTSLREIVNGAVDRFQPRSRKKEQEEPIKSNFMEESQSRAKKILGTI